MNFAVIAAGEGSRLAHEGIDFPKPLVPLCGVPLLSRLLDTFLRFQPESVSLIVNEQMTEVHLWVRHWQEQHPEVDLRLCVRSTPSSMHSLACMSELMPPGKFILTTVDTIFRSADFAQYVHAFQTMSPDEGGLFAVTPFVDDEKPLWITVDAEGFITSFADQGPAPFVSGGIYGLHTDTAFPVLHDCLAHQQSRMRNYQRALLTAGLRIKSFTFDKIMDIDHAADVRKAEQWLLSE